MTGTANIAITGVAGSSGLGDESISTEVMVETGFAGTTALGTSCNSFCCSCALGQQLTISLTSPTVWGEVDDSQTSGFTPVTDSQTANWSEVSDTQSSNWEEVA